MNSTYYLVMYSTSTCINCCGRKPLLPVVPHPQRRRRWSAVAVVLLWVSMNTSSSQRRQGHAFTWTRPCTSLHHHHHHHHHPSRPHRNLVQRINHPRSLPSPRLTIPSLYGIPIPQLDEITRVTSSMSTITATTTASGDGVVAVVGTVLRSLGSAFLSYFSLIAYYDRPRGELHPNIDTFVQVRPSQIIPNGGWGVVCRNATSIPKGTVLGTYPGVLIPLYPSTHRYKLQQYPNCETYIWRFSDNQYIIDPTNSVGELGEKEDDPHDHDGICYGGNPNLWGSIYFHQIFIPFVLQRFSFNQPPLPQQSPTTATSRTNQDRNHPQHWFRKSTLLCRINEPPKGYDVNVVTVEHLSNRSVSFVTERIIQEHEELFIDYGLNYDRSRYRL